MIMKMSINQFYYRFLRVLLSAFFVLAANAQEVPAIVLGHNGVSWKDIFDAGFRPKYLADMEYKSCSLSDIKFAFKRSGNPNYFEVGKGNLFFDVMEGNEGVYMIWHQGIERISIEEGVRRVNEFRKMFPVEIVGEIDMPTLHPTGTLVFGANKDITARVGDYIVIYGFDRGFDKDKPIIEHFYIAWNHPEKPLPKFNPSGVKVQPPAGYEWYSLDPLIDTPSPGVRNSVPPKHPVLTAEEMDKNRVESKKRKREIWSQLLSGQAKAEQQKKAKLANQAKSRMQIWIAVITVLSALVAGMWVWVAKRRRKFRQETHQ